MANTTLTQTGAQVQVDLDKVEGMANIKSVGSGLSLSSAGQLSASGGSGGLQGYNLNYVNRTRDADVRFIRIGNNNKLEYIQYTRNQIVSLTNVIAIINKAYYAQSLVSTTGYVYWLESHDMINLANFTTGIEHTDETWILLSDVTFDDEN